MKRILFIAAESDNGMACFASNIINTVKESNCYNIKSIFLNLDNKNRTFKRKINNEDDTIFLAYPKNKMLRTFYKIWPIKLIKCINKTIKSFNPNYVIFMTGDYSLSLYCSINHDKRFTYVVHDLIPHECSFKNIKDKLFRIWVDKGYKIMTENIFNLLTCSKYQYDELQKRYNDKRIGFIPFPSLLTNESINGNMSVPELRNISNYILFFGLINDYKGVDLLIEAFCDSPLCNTTKLVIAGRGELDIDNSSNNIIRLNRYIQEQELNDLYSKAELVVYPYRSATMSGVLTFPYYLNKKVLMSNIPFFMDYKSELSFYFEKENIEDLKEKLEIAYNSNEPQNMNVYNLFYSKEQLIDSFKAFFE